MKYDIAKYNTGTANSQGKILSLIAPESTVLEMGAATGYMTKEMCETLRCKVDIVEIDPEGFKQASKYARNGYCGDLNKDEWHQTFQGNRYDYILFADVLEHLTVPSKALKKAVELLKEDGTVIISIPNIGHNDILLKLAANEWNYTETGLLDDTHIHFWGRENLEPFLADAGLKMVMLDATYLRTCDTEQFRGKNVKVNTALYNVISQRPYGEVYQFVLCAQKQQYAEQKEIEMVSLLPDEEDNGTEFKCVECVSTAFFAGEDGYSSERRTTKYHRIFGQGSLIFPLVWDVNVPADCERIRLDPCENWNCIVSKINVLYAGRLIKPVPLNGIQINDHLLFATEDPQLEIRLLDAHGGSVHIEMQVQMIDPRNPLVASIEQYALEAKQLRIQEREALQNDIRKLMEDRHAHDCQLVEEMKSLQQQINALKEENLKKSYQAKKAAEQYTREKKQLEKKIVRAEKDKKISNDQAYEIGKLQGERQELLEYVQKTQEAYNAMLQKVATLEEQCVAYDRHVANIEQTLRQERDACQNIQIENAALREEAQKSNYNFELISSSQWWKLTAPGRKVMIAMKSTRLGGLLFRGIRSLKNEGLKKTAQKTVNVLAGKRPVPGELPPADCNAFVKQLQQHPGVICDLKKLQAYLEDTKPYQYRVLYVSHEMSLTGAPLVLMNFAKMVHEAGNQAIIVSPVDGPLRAEAERFGIPVVIVPDLFASNDVLDLVYPFNLVVACTIASAKIVSELNGMDIPVIWWIHEAMVSYHPGYLANMPQTLGKNIHVYSVCEYAKNMLLKFRPQYQSNILPYYMDDFANVKSNSSFALPPHGNKKVFTMVGSMEVRKGQDILVEAVRKLPRNILEKCLFVIVAKKYHKPFSKLIDDLCDDYPQNVIYYEQLSRDEIANLYKETDCLICASRDDPLPCVITEALAVGKPAICSEHTGYAAILKEMNSGLVYKNDDPQLLAEAIEKYLTKPTLQKKLQCNTRSTYEKHFTQKVFNERATALLNRHILHLTDEEAAANNIGSMSLQQIIEMSTPAQKSVSVVIPTYNAGEQFDELLSSLKKQKGIDQLEIVIVDSGSKDKTVEICRKHDVKLIQIPNEQFSHSGSRNMGAKAASGEILLFMTQDAMPVGKDWIEKLVTPIVKENVAAVSPVEKCPPETDLYYRVASSIHVNYLGNSKANLLNEGMGNGDRAGFRARSALNDVTTAINRKVFLRFQYRHDFAEDLDMGMRLIRSGYRVMLMSSVQTLHGHNRAAGYYFKRTLVDTVTTSQTILQMPVAGTCAQWDLAEMLGQGYGAMQWVYSTILKGKYDSLDKFHNALLKAFGQVRKLAANEMKSMPANADIYDDIMQAVADTLASCYMENSGPRYEVINAMEGYWSNALYPYAKKNVPWSADQAKEMLICINKQLACTMGCELARLSPDDSMYSQIHRYTAGV